MYCCHDCGCGCIDWLGQLSSVCVVHSRIKRLPFQWGPVKGLRSSLKQTKKCRKHLKIVSVPSVWIVRRLLGKKTEVTVEASQCFPGWFENGNCLVIVCLENKAWHQ
jgi:hypothetical protein